MNGFVSKKNVVRLLFCSILLLLVSADIGEPPHTFVTGLTATAAEVNENFSTIYDEFNGHIDNANLASDTASLLKVSGGVMAASGSFIGIGTATPGSSLDIKGTLRLSGSSSGYIGLAPAADAGSTIYTLPFADGTTGQVLTTNGSGILSWSTIPGGSSPWTSGSGLIYYNSGNVGIGISNPSRSLHINDCLRIEPTFSIPVSPSSGDIYMDGSDNSLKYFDGNNWKKLIEQMPQGMIAYTEAHRNDRAYTTSTTYTDVLSVNTPVSVKTDQLVLIEVWFTPSAGDHTIRLYNSTDDTTIDSIDIALNTPVVTRYFSEEITVPSLGDSKLIKLQQKVTGVGDGDIWCSYIKCTLVID